MQKWRIILISRLRLLAFLSLLAIGLGQLPLWYTELFSHFLPHYAVIFGLTALCTGRKYRYLWLLCALGAFIWLMQGGVSQRLPETAGQQRLLWYNAHLHNTAAADEVARIRKLAPDMLAIGEMHPEAASWRELRADYPQGCRRALCWKRLWKRSD